LTTNVPGFSPGRSVAVEENRFAGRAASSGFDALERMILERVQQFVQDLLEEELTAFLGRRRSARRNEVDSGGGYRNGHGKPRKLSLKTGTITVRRPRARNLEEPFESRLLPLFAKRSREISEVLPELYLHGLSKGDFELALRGLLGDGAPLSASSIERLRAKWQLDYDAWRKRQLLDGEVVYVWADGIYVKAGLEKEKAALLVVIAAYRDGRKEVVAVEPGYRESMSSWRDVFRDLTERGLQEPKLIIADGNTGVWAAAAQVWPGAKEQRCWNHKIVNVLDKLPKKLQAEARALLVALPYAPTAAEARRLADDFCQRYEQEHPRAVACLRDDWQRMTSFYAFPAQHWKHIRTTNVVESPFAAVRLRTDAAKRFKKAANATAMIWRVLCVAQKRFRRLDAAELARDVHAGRQFADGKPVSSRSTEEDAA
jgi:transposase-like protein